MTTKTGELYTHSRQHSVLNLFVFVAIFWAVIVDELLAEKEKYKTISEDLDGTFEELSTF